MDDPDDLRVLEQAQMDVLRRVAEDAIAAYKAAARAHDREHHSAKRREWVTQNADRVAAGKLAWARARRATPEGRAQQNAYQRAYRNTDEQRAKQAIRAREYRQKNLEQVRAAERKRRSIKREQEKNND